ncbi:MAG: hypothetical protein AB2417_09410 [Clostridiaceae bacterium]
MKSETRTTHEAITTLFFGWLTILVSYILIYIVSAIFGFVLSSSILSGILAIVPYLCGAGYFLKVRSCQNGWFYTLGIIFPAVLEKIILYLMGASFYGISLLNVETVIKMVSSHEPYTNIFTHPRAHYILNISYLNFRYIFCSIAFSVLIVVLLTYMQKRINASNKLYV